MNKSRNIQEEWVQVHSERIFGYKVPLHPVIFLLDYSEGSVKEEHKDMIYYLLAAATILHAAKRRMVTAPDD